MKKLLLILPFILLTAFVSADGVSASSDDLIKRSSNHNVKDTMDRLEKIVKSKKLTVFARIDHRAGAKSVGMDMNDAEVLIFGSPKLGTAIMKFDAAAGLDLPLRVVVYADNDGKVWLSYHNPQSLSKNFDVSKSKALVMAEGALGKMTSKAAE